MSLGLLLGGQGRQHPAMLRWLLDDPSPPPELRALDAALGEGWRQRFSDAAWLQRNRVAQPLLTGLMTAAWTRLQPLLPQPAAMAGYSVGELAAARVAGVCDADTALRLAQARAAAMDGCAAARGTGLMSLSGAAAPRLQSLATAHGLECAISLGPQRAVFGGPLAALAAAARAARVRGLQAQQLTVPLASHTSWLRDAVPGWAAALARAPLCAPALPLLTAVDAGLPRSAQAWREAAARQIAAPLAWSDCLEALAERNVRYVLEIGPGDALARLWNERWPERPARSIDEFGSAQAVARWVERQLQATGGWAG